MRSLLAVLLCILTLSTTSPGADKAEKPPPNPRSTGSR